jgi:hypothetical protein
MVLGIQVAPPGNGRFGPAQKQTPGLKIISPDRVGEAASRLAAFDWLVMN